MKDLITSMAPVCFYFTVEFVVSPVGETAELQPAKYFPSKCTGSRETAITMSFSLSHLGFRRGEVTHGGCEGGCTNKQQQEDAQTNNKKKKSVPPSLQTNNNVPTSLITNKQ